MTAQGREKFHLRASRGGVTEDTFSKWWWGFAVVRWRRVGSCQRYKYEQRGGDGIVGARGGNCMLSSGGKGLSRGVWQVRCVGLKCRLQGAQFVLQQRKCVELHWRLLWLCRERQKSGEAVRSMRKYCVLMDRKRGTTDGRGETEKRDWETDRVRAQSQNLISFLVCGGITGELADLGV